MQYSIQSSEITGFVALLNAADFYSQEKQEKDKWLQLLPELQNTDFEKLVHYIRKEKQSAGPNCIGLISMIRMSLPDIQSLDDLKKIIAKSPNPEVNPDTVNAMIDSVYPVYQKFYQRNANTIGNTAEQTQNLLNSIAVEPLDQVQHFFNPEYKSAEKQSMVYMFPTAITGIRGQNVHTLKSGQSFQGNRLSLQADRQWLALGADMLDGTRQIDIGKISSIIYHEKVHGLFHDSRADKKLSEYLKGSNEIVKILKDFPQLKRNPNVSASDEAEMMVNEAITSAFEGMLNEDVRGKKKEVLYENHVINTMAHKAMPLLREAMKTGETFGPEFIKKFEKEFLSVVPEMLEQMENKSLRSSLSKICNNNSKVQMGKPKSITKVPFIPGQDQTNLY